MEYTPQVQRLIDDPFGGRTPVHVREACASTLAQQALAHEPPAFLLEKHVKDHGGSISDAQALFEETKRFLLVGVLFDQALAPSLPVDQMWHSFILFTKDYHDFCDKLGGYIHHRPIPQGDAAQPPLEPTVQLMEAAFGPLSEVFWPQLLGSYGIMDCKKGA